MTHGLYAKEVAFYRELAPHLAIRTPRAYAAEVSDDGSAMRERARDAGWPGFRARALRGTYSPGATSGDWLEFA